MTYKGLAEEIIKSATDPELSPEALDRVYRGIRDRKGYSQFSEEVKSVVHEAICSSMKEKLKALGRWDIDREPLAWNYVPGSRWPTDEELAAMEREPLQEIEVYYREGKLYEDNKTAPQKDHGATEAIYR